MAMYEARPAIVPTTDLNQGDILKDVVRPGLVPADNVRRLLSRKKVEDPPDRTALRRRDGELRAFSRLEYLDHALVLSASCDNARGSLPLILVPITNFAFRTTAPGDRWREVSAAATGSASPRQFYLPADEEFGLVRSEAQLANLFVVTHELLGRCVDECGTSRVCGLNKEAVAHMQWALNLFFSRNPRDDDAWPSTQDFELKLEVTESALATARERGDLVTIAEHEAMRRHVLARLGREAPQAQATPTEQATVAPIPEPIPEPVAAETTDRNEST